MAIYPEVIKEDPINCLVVETINWTRTNKKLILSWRKVDTFYRQVPDLNYNPGDPHVILGDQTFQLEDFLYASWLKFKETPGFIVGEDIIDPIDPKKVAITARRVKINPINFQIIFRFLKANAGNWFTIAQIGEKLGYFEGLDPVIHKRKIKQKKESIRGVISDIHLHSKLIEKRQIGKERAFRIKK